MNDCYVYVYCDPRYRMDEDCLGIKLEFLPIYVGYGRRDRAMWHLKFRKCDRNLLKVHKLRAILAVGMQPIILKVVEGLAKEEAQEMERKWIAEIGTISEVPGIKRGTLVNLTAGGDGGATWIGRKMTEEHKEKIRRANTGAQFTEERKRHLSEAQSRRVIVISDEKRKKMVDGIHRMTAEDRHRASNGWRGNVWVNKNGKQQRVKPERVEEFIKNGWARGFLYGGNRYHKKDQCKCCGVKDNWAPDGTISVYDDKEVSSAGN